MGKLIAVMNTGRTPIYVGDLVVVPGNTRHFDENLVPPHLRPRDAAPVAQPAEPPPPAADAITEAFGVKPGDDLVARIREAASMLPSDPEQLQDALERCKALAAGEEAATAPRIDVLEVLAELQLAIGEALVKAGDGASLGPEANEAGLASAAAATDTAPAAGHEHAHTHRHDWHGMTKAELQAYLKKRHVKFETDANKDRLIELAKAHP